MPWPEIEECSGRYELKLSGKRIADRLERENGVLDESLFDLTQLNHLEVSNIGLRTIDGTSLSKLVNLQSLNLTSNDLSTIPPDLKQLSRLKHLDMSNNRISELSGCVFPSSLETFTITNNEITTFSISQCQLDSLTTIDASSNRINTFLICNAPVLRQIILTSNELEELPECLSDLPGLKLLDVSLNKLTALCPEILLSCPRLKDLIANDNPIVDGRLKKLLDQRAKTRTVADYIANKGGSLKAGGKHLDGSRSETSISNRRTQKQSDLADVNSSSSSYVVTPGSFTILLDIQARQQGYHLVCCVLRGVDLSSGRLDRVIKEQNRLHDEILNKRVYGTLATHDLSKIDTSSLVFRVTPLNGVSIIPLGQTKSIDASALYADLMAEAERKRKQNKKDRLLSLHRYLNIVTIKERIGCLSDGQTGTLSLHPLTNCDQTKLSPSSRDVLLEVCSTDSLDRARRAMDSAIDAFIQTGAWPANEQSVIEQIRILNETDLSLKYVYPSRTDLQRLKPQFKPITN